MDSVEKPNKDPIREQAPIPRHGESSSSGDEMTITHNEHPLHAEHGVLIDDLTHMRTVEEEYAAHHEYLWPRIRHHLREPFMEFMGTFTMIVFGDGSVAQVLLSANPNLPASSQNKGDYQSISWG
jgi:aquaglyceroporin related protein, other eukaryote